MIPNRLAKLVACLAIWLFISAAALAGAEPSQQTAETKSPEASKTQTVQVAKKENAEYLLVAESSMVKIMPDRVSSLLRDLYGDRLLLPGHPVEIAVAGGEVEAGQIIIAPQKGALRNVEFQISDLKEPGGVTLPTSSVTLSVMGYVKTSPETKLAYKVERTGWFPDPILPFIDRFDVASDKVQSLWLSIQCPTGQQAGVYQGVVTVSPENAAVQTIPVRVRVFDFDIPKKRSLSTWIPTFTKNLERIHGDNWSREMYWRYVDFLHAHRINMDNAYRDDRSPEPDLKVEDVKRLVAGGQDAWCLRYIMQVGPGGDDPKGVDPAHFEEYLDKAINEAKATLEVFKQAGAEHLCYMYLFDEVSREEQFDRLLQVGRRVREALPGVPILTTAFDLRSLRFPPRLEEVIDIWFPILPVYFDAQRRTRMQTMRENGTMVGWYTTFWPPRPFPNFLVEYDAIEARILMGAMTQKFKPDGFGYWAINFWPFNEKPITKGPYTDWNPRSSEISHGDGGWICAGKDGPITTIRFENFRDGLEDYEYYQLLEQAIAQAKKRGLSQTLIDRAQSMLTVPDGIVRTLTAFTRDPELLAQHRLRIAETIEALGSRVGK